MDPRPAPRPPHRSTHVPVVFATSSDLSFVVAVQKEHGNVLGFLPRQALAEKIRRCQVHVARAGGRPAGFLHHGSLARPEVRIFQAAVERAARGRGVGRALVDDLLDRARAAGAAGVSLRCLCFLDSNAFWSSVGFELLTTEPGAKGGLNVWVKRLRPRARFASRVHPCPACGAPTVDTWVRGARRFALCPACVAAASNN